MSELRIDIAAGTDARPNPLLIVTVDGKHRAAEEVAVTKPKAKAAAANRWAERFGVDAANILAKLDEIGLQITANLQSRQESLACNAPHVRDLARGFIDDHIRPGYHEDGRRVFSESLSRLIPVSVIWKSAPDETVDAVGKTVEGRPTGNSMGAVTYEAKVRLLRIGIEQAMAEICRTIPDRSVVEVDGAVDRDELLSRVAAFITKPRTIRSSTSVPRDICFFDWACRLAVGEGWQQCGINSVFGRRETDDGLPEIAVTGSLLVQELHYSTAKRLAADLRSCGIAEPDKTIRVTAKVRRVWVLSPAVLDSISSQDPAQEPLP